MSLTLCRGPFQAPAQPLPHRPHVDGELPRPASPTHVGKPENRASFWADPEAAGNALILQGELMMKMGEILVKSGRELLEKAKK